MLKRAEQKCTASYHEHGFKKKALTASSRARPKHIKPSEKPMSKRLKDLSDLGNGLANGTP